MEYDKINNLLRSEDDSESENLSKFVTRQYVKVNSLSNTYNENKSIRSKTPMLRSDLCDYADAYILIEGIIIVGGNAPRDRQNRPVILKNNAPFISCITRINGELIEDVDDLDVVMPMYSKNYRKTMLFNIKINYWATRMMLIQQLLPLLLVLELLILIMLQIELTQKQYH